MNFGPLVFKTFLQQSTCRVSLKSANLAFLVKNADKPFSLEHQSFLANLPPTVFKGEQTKITEIKVFATTAKIFGF